LGACPTVISGFSTAILVTASNLLTVTALHAGIALALGLLVS
jgi:hypothetical protein